MYEGTDRNRQIDWINQQADGITYFDIDGSATAADADDLVNFWLSQPDTTLPAWFDDADKTLLISLVGELLS